MSTALKIIFLKTMIYIFLVINIYIYFKKMFTGFELGLEFIYW